MGHLQRALLLAECCNTSLILHQNPTAIPNSANIISPPNELMEPWIRAFLRQSSEHYDTLIVDSFPLGLFHELSATDIQAFSHSILIARYLQSHRYSKYEEGCSFYSSVYYPYSQKYSEWSNHKHGIALGPLHRHVPIQFSGITHPLVCIGDPLKIPLRWRNTLPANTVYINEYFSALPTAERYFCVGAGYNLTWELYEHPVPVCHVPLEKRYDDQFHRAGLLGRSCTSYLELQRFLG